VQHAQREAQRSQDFVHMTGPRIGEPEAGIDGVDEPRDDKDLRELDHAVDERRAGARGGAASPPQP
jgi:hypothetical protein